MLVSCLLISNVIWLQLHYVSGCCQCTSKEMWFDTDEGSCKTCVCQYSLGVCGTWSCEKFGKCTRSFIARYEKPCLLCNEDCEWKEGVLCNEKNKVKYSKWWENKELLDANAIPARKIICTREMWQKIHLYPFCSKWKEYDWPEVTPRTRILKKDSSKHRK